MSYFGALNFDQCYALSLDALLPGLWPGGGGVHCLLPPLGGRAPPLPRLRQHLRPDGSQDQRLNLRGNDDKFWLDQSQASLLALQPISIDYSIA